MITYEGKIEEEDYYVVDLNMQFMGAKAYLEKWSQKKLLINLFHIMCSFLSKFSLGDWKINVRN